MIPLRLHQSPHFQFKMHTLMDMMIPTCNLRYCRGRGRRIIIQDQAKGQDHITKTTKA
jgi:hypothetical protein